MIFRKVAILLILFIFGIITQVWANPVKSINNAANQEMIMKMDENKVGIQKKTEVAKESVKSLKKRQVRSQSSIPYTDYGAIMGSVKSEINFLRTPEQKKRPLLADSLDKLVFSYEFKQNVWRDKFLSSREITEAKFQNSDSGQAILRPYPSGNKYFEEGRIPETFKLLQSKREELFKEIFMGFRFSFNPMSEHMFLEMNVTPSSEIGPGIIISF